MFKGLKFWTLAVVLINLAAYPAYAIVPPSTVLSEGAWRTGLSAEEWLIYGSVVIILFALFMAAVVLISRLIVALFRRECLTKHHRGVE